MSWQVLAAAGAVNHEELVKKAAEAFGSIPDEDPVTSVTTLLRKVRTASLLVSHLGPP